MTATVVAVAHDGEHRFSKPLQPSITLLTGHDVSPGELGENVATRGLDLLGLPAGTTLRIGPNAVVEITGLRNPCKQIDQFQSGLLKQAVVRKADREPTFKAGVMGAVLADGKVSPGDRIDVLLPAGTHRPLQRV